MSKTTTKILKLVVVTGLLVMGGAISSHAKTPLSFVLGVGSVITGSILFTIWSEID